MLIEAGFDIAFPAPTPKAPHVDVHPLRDADVRRGLLLRSTCRLRLIFYTSNRQHIDFKRQSALKKRLGTTFC
jgi:hypothetical protein